MNTKTRLILTVALLGISTVVLAVAFVQCRGTPAPATTVQPATDRAATEDTATLSGKTAAPVTPGAIAATTPPDGATVEPGTTTVTPILTPTLTKEEVLAQTLAQSGGQFASSVDECSEILTTEDWCGVIKGAVRIIRSEWEELFPETEFYVVRRDLYGGKFVQQRNMLIVEQDGQRYTAETFDRLLKANGVITITDENRELVAKAFALMTIPDYLGEEVVFTEWEEADFDTAAFDYTHCLTAWTRIGGVEFKWCYVFRNERLKIVSERV